MQKKILCSLAALLAAVAGSSAQAAMVTGNATYSTSVETSGNYGSTSFQAAGDTADQYPAFGVVAFDLAPFASLAGAGIDPAVTISAAEYNSTTAATMTSAGSVIDFYFAQKPTTTGSELGTYDATNAPGGFNPTTFNADLVGSFSYQQVANQYDTINLNLSSSDVAYVNNLLTQGSGTLEFFAVATTTTASGRWDGTYANAPASLTLKSAAAPEPASLSLLAIGGAALVTRRRRTA